MSNQTFNMTATECQEAVAASNKLFNETVEAKFQEGILNIILSRLEATMSNLISNPDYMPWKTLVDDGWMIVGMNHYNLHNTRHLFCSMAKDGLCITAEGIDELDIFKSLLEKAYE